MNTIKNFKISIEKPLPEKILELLISIVNNEKTFVCPTETSYLIAGDPYSEKAVNAIYEMKKRNKNLPLPLIVPDLKTAQKLAVFNENALKLTSKYWPGPFTIILPLEKNIRMFVSKSNTVAMRVPAFPILQQLLNRYGGPLISTSANLSGKKEPYSIRDMSEFLTNGNKKIELILDAGTLLHNPPSQIVDLTQDNIKIVRS